MKTCKDCIHSNVCTQDILATDLHPYIDFSVRDDVEESCDDFKDKSKFIELPCSIGDPYFTIERFCTEGGYHEEKAEVRLSDCEYCCEECDMELRVVEHKFHNAIIILQKERYIGEYIFLTREKAEKKLEELN